jgi:DNA-binding response OmpR family regulator
MKILIVDDDKLILSLVSGILPEYINTETAEDAGSAIEAYHKALDKNEPFDLVLLDIRMPDTPGIDVVVYIRENERKENFQADKQIKIIMISSFSDEDIKIASSVSGADDYIVKPITRDVLIEKINDLGFSIS